MDGSSSVKPTNSANNTEVHKKPLRYSWQQLAVWAVVIFLYAIYILVSMELHLEDDFVEFSND